MGKYLLPGILIGAGVGLVIVAAVFGFVVVPNIINGKIEEEVRLVNGTDTWEKWETNPVPVYLRFFVFNITNPDDIQLKESNVNRRVNPVLHEIGPYVYRQERRKVDIEIDENAETIAYRQIIDYFWEPELSFMTNENGDKVFLHEDDIFNIPNLPFLAISTSLFSRNLGDISKGFVAQLVADGEGVVKSDVTVKEFIWDGFDIHPLYGIILALLPADERPPEFEGNKFAFYRTNNGSDDGHYIVKSGVSDSQDFGRIVSWEGSNTLNWWHSPPVSDENPNATPPENDIYCNMINGTDGGVFKPFLDEDSLIQIFVTDICRSIVFEHKGDDEHMGVKGLLYGFPDSFYEDPHINEDNYCFCSQPEGELEGLCTKGVIRIFPCKNGAPIVTSSPHFRGGDPNFLNLVTGLSPSEEHDTTALLEPNSGILLRISKKVQISLEVQNFNNFFPYFEDIKYMLFPVFWANEYVEMDQENIDDIKGRLITPIKIVTITKWVLIGVGALAAAIGAAVLVKRRM